NVFSDLLYLHSFPTRRSSDLGLGERHNTRSSGLGDLRIGAGYWLFKPGTKTFNYAIGAGIKLPTGDYEYMDTFYNQGPDRNQSRSEEHTSELQSRENLVCRLL